MTHVLSWDIIFSEFVEDVFTVVNEPEQSLEKPIRLITAYRQTSSRYQFGDVSTATAFPKRDRTVTQTVELPEEFMNTISHLSLSWTTDNIADYQKTYEVKEVIVENGRRKARYYPDNSRIPINTDKNLLLPKG